MGAAFIGLVGYRWAGGRPAPRGRVSVRRSATVRGEHHPLCRHRRGSRTRIQI